MKHKWETRQIDKNELMTKLDALTRNDNSEERHRNTIGSSPRSWDEMKSKYDNESPEAIERIENEIEERRLNGSVWGTHFKGERKGGWR